MAVLLNMDLVNRYCSDRVNIITYWEGPKPPYINICLSSLASVCCEHFNVLVFDPSSLPKQLYSMLNPRYKKLNFVAHRVDCIRIALLMLYGGLWVDADTLWLRPPVGLVDRSIQCGYMIWDDPVRVLNGYIYFDRCSPILKEWLNFINEKLSGNLCGEEWTEYGEKIATPLVLKYQEMRPDTVVRIPRELFLPVDLSKDASVYFESVEIERYLSSAPYCFGLNHSYFDRVRPDITRQSTYELLRGDTLFHKVIQYAMKGRLH